MVVLSCSSLYGQRTLGVTWNIPKDQKQAITQLREFHELGISVIEVEQPPSAAIWQKIDSLQFKVYGSLGIQFPTTSTFRQPDSTLIENIQKKASVYLSEPSVAAIGLFEYGAVSDSSFWKSLQPVARQLKTKRQLPFYFTSRRLAHVDTLPDHFIILDTFVTTSRLDTLSVPQDTLIGAYRYTPSKKLAPYLTPFKDFLEATSEASQKPIFVNSDWLFSMQKQHPQLVEILQGFSSEEDAVFPLPQETLPSPQSSTLPVVILLIVWGSIAFHYHSSPLYRKSLFRYFTAHKFFINDIFQRQIRSPLPGVIIIFQHALLLASTAFVTIDSLLSPLGQTALFYHMPQLTLMGNTHYSFWGWALLACILISFFCALWIYVAHKSIHSFIQVATIYAWPLQLNFVLATVAITLFSSGTHTVTIVIFTALAFAIFLATFFFAAIDVTQSSRSKLTFQLKTTIPYILLLAGVSTWVLLQEQWVETVKLALNLK